MLKEVGLIVIAFETNDEKSTVRIHDDYCESNIENSLFCLNNIVSQFYKRKIFDCGKSDEKKQ